MQLSSTKSISNNKNDNIVSGITTKDFMVCGHFQMCLNILGNHLNARLCQLTETRDLTTDKPDAMVKESTFSSQQLLLSSLLKSLLFFTSTQTGGMSNYNSGKDLLSKSDFLALFSQLCVYGMTSIHETATSVLYNLCSSCDWWEDGLIEVYRKYFGYSSVVPIPYKRFDVFFNI